MRLIDADATELAVVKATTYGDALRAVREQPSIDIVRCGECKQWNIEALHCNRERGLICAELDDFCSYGEVRDE